MTRALGTPQRGQTMPDVERFAMVFLLTSPLDAGDPVKDTRIVQIVEALRREYEKYTVRPIASAVRFTLEW